jgi:methylglutaconyl-CoA hydratase
MSEQPSSASVLMQIHGSVATVTLNRPEVRNAFDAGLIASLTAVFRDLSARDDLRAVVLQGAGPSFCAGADVTWMRTNLDWTREQNIADAMTLAEMLATIDACPLAVVGRIHGVAFGGGIGLVACCDIAIAAADTRFAFSEARLGILPATIAPYVIAKIGPGQARALFLTAERFDATRALQIGLVHRVMPAADLDGAVEETVRQLRSSGPQAIRRAKDLIARLRSMHDARPIAQITAETIAQARVSAEGQEGLRAFLEKRRPSWAEES